MSRISARKEIGDAGSLDSVRQLVGMERPVSLRRLIEAYNSPVVLEEPLVTNVAIGGHQKVTLERTGAWRWDGHLRATGLFSYDTSLLTFVTGDNAPALVLNTHGRISGTNEPGDREFRWNQTGHNPLFRSAWPSLRTSRLEHNLQHDEDVLGGPLGDVWSFLFEAAAANAIFAGSGLVIALGTELVDAFDLEALSLPGIAGLAVAGGVLLVTGPYGLVPAIVAGAAVGMAVDAALDVHEIKQADYEYFNTIFGGQLPRDRSRIVLTNLLGAGGRAFVWPGPGNTIWVNVGAASEDPTGYMGNGEPVAEIPPNTRRAPGQLMAHELTHVWQIEHTDFVPSWMCAGLYNQVPTLFGEKGVYDYDTSAMNWSDYNDEQQGKIVEHWYAGSLTQTLDVPPRNTNPQSGYLPQAEYDEEDPRHNPYWRFIRDHIRAGVD